MFLRVLVVLGRLLTFFAVFYCFCVFLADFLFSRFFVFVFVGRLFVLIYVFVICLMFFCSGSSTNILYTMFYYAVAICAVLLLCAISLYVYTYILLRAGVCVCVCACLLFVVVCRRATRITAPG